MNDFERQLTNIAQRRDKGEMKVETAFSPDHPMREAFDKYSETDEYVNSRQWAQHEAYVDGAMWAAFCAGYIAASQHSAQSVSKDLAKNAASKIEARCCGCLPKGYAERAINTAIEKSFE